MFLFKNRYKLLLFFSVLHKISFVVFLIMSLLHMLTAYAIARTYRSGKDHNDNMSITWKQRALFSSFASILSACFFFYRHNTYCEPLSEYNLKILIQMLCKKITLSKTQFEKVNSRISEKTFTKYIFEFKKYDQAHKFLN